MEKRDFVEMLWKYFELHSSQRMQMMNFYIILESLFFTGLFALFTADKEMCKFCSNGTPILKSAVHSF